MSTPLLARFVREKMRLFRSATALALCGAHICSAVAENYEKAIGEEQSFRVIRVRRILRFWASGRRPAQHGAQMLLVNGPRVVGQGRAVLVARPSGDYLPITD